MRLLPTLPLLVTCVMSLETSAPAADQVPAPIQEVKNRQAAQKELSLAEFKSLLESKTAPAIADLRRAEERKEFGYLAESVSVDYLRGDFEAAFEKAFPNKEAPVIVMCAVGGRASLAIEDLKALGYTNLSTVKGSFNAYKASGGKIVAGSK